MFKCVRQGMVAAALVLAVAASTVRAEDGPPKGIVWRIGLYRSFKQACWEKKPLVVFFFQEKCPSCDSMKKTLLDDRLNVLGDQAIFVWQDADQEDPKGNVSALIKGLEIKNVPFVVVLDVNGQRIEDIGRVVGYYPPEETLRRLQSWLDRSLAVNGTGPAATTSPVLSPASPQGQGTGP